MVQKMIIFGVTKVPRFFQNWGVNSISGKSEKWPFWVSGIGLKYLRFGQNVSFWLVSSLSKGRFLLQKHENFMFFGHFGKSGNPKIMVFDPLFDPFLDDLPKYAYFRRSKNTGII